LGTIRLMALSGRVVSHRNGWGGARSARRWLLLAMAVLAGMMPLMASPGTAGAAQNPNKPVVEEVDVTFPAPNLTSRCGFDVWAHVYGTFTFKVTPNGVEHQRIRYQHTFSGPGGSVTANHVENVTFTSTMSSDGTVVDTFTVTGTLLYHLVIPGYGSIANNSGREVFQLTWQWDEASGGWELIDEQIFPDSGPNDGFSDADYAVICAQLG
jgi:hypothetical protein